MLNVGLASEILFVSADTQVDAGDFHGIEPRWVNIYWLTIAHMANNVKSNVIWLPVIWLSILAIKSVTMNICDECSRLGTIKRILRMLSFNSPRLLSFLESFLFLPANQENQKQ